MTRLKKLINFRIFKKKDKPEDSENSDNLKKLSKDSYAEAYEKLKDSLQSAKDLEEDSIKNLKVVTEKHTKIRTLRHKIEEGYYPSDKEASMVGLLKIS